MFNLEDITKLLHDSEHPNGRIVKSYTEIFGINFASYDELLIERIDWTFEDIQVNKMAELVIEVYKIPYFNKAYEMLRPSNFNRKDEFKAVGIVNGLVSFLKRNDDVLCSISILDGEIEISPEHEITPTIMEIINDMLVGWDLVDSEQLI